MPIDQEIRMISKQSEIKMRLFDLLSQSIGKLTHKEINDIKEV